jgi:hypothetical protein
MLESAMEVIWDLLIFFALVAVGLVVLNLLVTGAETALSRWGQANRDRRPSSGKPRPQRQVTKGHRPWPGCWAPINPPSRRA